MLLMVLLITRNRIKITKSVTIARIMCPAINLPVFSDLIVKDTLRAELKKIESQAGIIFDYIPIIIVFILQTDLKQTIKCRLDFCLTANTSECYFMKS